MNNSSSWLPALLGLPLFHADWVLYLLLGTSVASVAVMLERAWFYRRRRFDVETYRSFARPKLLERDFAALASALEAERALEARVLRAALRSAPGGAAAVEHGTFAELGREKRAYERGLDLLATIASNAPYVGLLGTVLGIVRAFRDLAANLEEASSSVMAGIGEALIATAVGLMVAIPALIAFNVFKARVRVATSQAQELARELLCELCVETEEAERSGWPEPLLGARRGAVGVE